MNRLEHQHISYTWQKRLYTKSTNRWIFGHFIKISWNIDGDRLNPYSQPALNHFAITDYFVLGLSCFCKLQLDLFVSVPKLSLSSVSAQDKYLHAVVKRDYSCMIIVITHKKGEEDVRNLINKIFPKFRSEDWVVYVQLTVIILLIGWTAIDPEEPPAAGAGPGVNNCNPCLMLTIVGVLLFSCFQCYTAAKILFLLVKDSFFPFTASSVLSPSRKNVPISELLGNQFLCLQLKLQLISSIMQGK